MDGNLLGLGGKNKRKALKEIKIFFKTFDDNTIYKVLLVGITEESYDLVNRG